VINAIKIENLQFRWQPTLPLVLEIEQLEVRLGESVFIKGPSGSGKTTLLNLIGGVLDPLDGQLEVLGNDFNELSHPQRDVLRGDHMGFIFQQFNLMPYLSVLENVTLPIEFSSQKREMIKEMKSSAESEAKRLLEHLKLKVDDVISKPVTQLSVGQQQRVAVARALMGRPSLIIADEPTSALDADARESFWHQALEYRKH
jgi:putative ABC transport system ATP-binding protein